MGFRGTLTPDPSANKNNARHGGERKELNFARYFGKQTRNHGKCGERSRRDILPCPAVLRGAFNARRCCDVQLCLGGGRLECTGKPLNGDRCSPEPTS